MTTARIKVSKSDKSIKAVISATYPEWKGRKVFVKAATSYQLSNYWSEGSRDFVQAYNLTTGVAAHPSGTSCTPFNQDAHLRIDIPEGVLLVEHSIFCGKDGGVTIYVNPENLVKFLPVAASEATPL